MDFVHLRYVVDTSLLVRVYFSITIIRLEEEDEKEEMLSRVVVVCLLAILKMKSLQLHV